ncbi:hypothetical protein SAMN04488498_12263 [Mesorhizobium albiziae]|uniref:Uncharacterized protein n=1 Tax=Neomesorhizobium albiziae TaxID=335020 RepID=A0A1I4E5S4_9HYPH|nr:hypothetical protein [Mesorhizobium albiziae]SFL00509.1 hypothetical protein SAMN04488498_12263 [Mesorhizobium albiziae]
MNEYIRPVGSMLSNPKLRCAMGCEAVKQLPERRGPGELGAVAIGDRPFSPTSNSSSSLDLLTCGPSTAWRERRCVRED